MRIRRVRGMVCVALKGRTRMANRNKARMNRYLAGLYHWDSTLGCTKNLWGTLSPERRKKKTRKNDFFSPGIFSHQVQTWCVPLFVNVPLFVCTQTNKLTYCCPVVQWDCNRYTVTKFVPYYPGGGHLPWYLRRLDC